MEYPKYKKADVTEEWFDTKLADPYAWLKDAHSQEVLNFVQAENEYTDQFFETFNIEEKIAQLKSDRLPNLVSCISPYKDNFLATKISEGNYSVVILDKDFNKTGMLEKPEMEEGELLLEACACPHNTDILACMIQYPGAARPSIAVCDMKNMKMLYVLSGSFSYAWSRNDGCLYITTTHANSETQISHTIVTKYNPRTNTSDTIYQDNGFSIFGQVHASEDGRYIMMMICQDYSLAQWMAYDTETGETIVLTDQPREWKYVDSLNGLHYFVSRSDVQNGALIAVQNDGEKKIVYVEKTNILEEGISKNNEIFLIVKADVSNRLIQVNTGNEIELPSPFGTLGIIGKTDDEILLKFESFTDAPRVLGFNGKQLRNIYITEDTDYSDIIVEQLFATSLDGTKVPYYMVHRKDAVKNEDNPVIMYGYGGYNFGMPPSYLETVSNIRIADWVRRGAIYINCNLRGGDEYGARWHEAGMLTNKRHCFEDFIAIAEEIIENGWARKGRIGIIGCSNGGLLMSTLVTMRPDLWGCVIDSVPHTDMVHFAEDDRGPMYITEYGNPRESKEMFEYLLSYSPYHNVKACDYPPTYIQTGELDNNVPPYHGKKLAARMQENNTSQNPILLRVLAKGGHDRGAGDVFWKTVAEIQAFMEYYLGL